MQEVTIVAFVLYRNMELAENDNTKNLKDRTCTPELLSSARVLKAPQL